MRRRTDYTGILTKKKREREKKGASPACRMKLASSETAAISSRLNKVTNLLTVVCTRRVGWHRSSDDRQRQTERQGQRECVRETDRQAHESSERLTDRQNERADAKHEVTEALREPYTAPPTLHVLRLLLRFAFK